MMTSILPLCVSGETLGERHRFLNDSVAACVRENLPLCSVQNLPEDTPVDRLFKIHLASQQRNLEYIVSQLQHDDLLYVSNALRATWLLQHEEVIDPDHLEKVLYPSMVVPAVRKLRQWLYTHMRDPTRCRRIYQYYKNTDFHYAVKFLWRCSNEFLLDEAPKILEKLTPRYLKLLCESCPRVAELFFGAIETNRNVRSMYLNDQKHYYESIKCVLKSDAGIYLDIIEKYFNYHMFDKLSRIATKHIMRQQRARFDRKPELYTLWLLDMGALAQALSGAECEELVLKLARAEYLHYLFSYKAVEPLIKRLDKDKRTVLKKRVFVDKDVGEIIKDWPYAAPEQPIDSPSNVHIFEDREISLPVFSKFYKKRKLKKKYGSFKHDYCCMAMSACHVQTLLNRLYDEFRFFNFGRTFIVLKKRMKTESSAQNRQYMMIVLVSKAGGHAESVEALLKYLNEQHSNEPVQVRAAVVRSLAKRAYSWRLPNSGWQQLLLLARGLGLDGSPAEAPCIEGMHSAVLRHLLESTICPDQLLTAFFDNFSTFKEYSLSGDEKKIVINSLPQLLLTAIEVETDPKVIMQRFDNILDTLLAYKLRTNKCEGLVPAVAKFSGAHPIAAENLLLRLYRDRVGRRELFRETFVLIQTDASYVNALRHAPDVINDDILVKSLTKNNLKPEQFLRKLAVYFSEPDGMAHRFLRTLNAAFVDTSNNEKCFARPLVYLGGPKLAAMLNKLGTAPRRSPEARLAGAMKVNAHVARPPLDIEGFGWRRAGARAVVSRVRTCRAADVDQAAARLATWRHTARAALAMTDRASNHYELFVSVAAVRPKVVLQFASPYFQRQNPCDPRIWTIFESTLKKIDVSENQKICQRLLRFKSMASEVKAQYCTILYKRLKHVEYSGQFSKFKDFEMETLLSEVVNVIPLVNEKIIEGLIIDFIDDDLIDKEVNKKCPDRIIPIYMSMVAKFLLLCKTEDAQKARLKSIGEPFFMKMGSICSISKTADARETFLSNIDEFLLGLKYMKVFLDPDYTSCLPVMEQVAVWMKEILPLEMGFQRFAYLHISMLYFKTIRQCVKQASGVFSDDVRLQQEGVDIVGRALGQYLSHEVALLTDKYFDSVVELYKKALIHYIDAYFEWDSDYVKARLITPLAMSILENADGSVTRLSVHLLKEYYYNLDDKMKNDVKAIFKDKASAETMFLAQSLQVYRDEFSIVLY